MFALITISTIALFVTLNCLYLYTQLTAAKHDAFCFKKIVTLGRNHAKMDERTIHHFVSENLRLQKELHHRDELLVDRLLSMCVIEKERDRLSVTIKDMVDEMKANGLLVEDSKMDLYRPSYSTDRENTLSGYLEN